MKVEMKRFVDNGDASGTLLYIDGKFECFLIEDQHQTKKVMSETRIPDGEYKLGIRKAGSIHERYAKKFAWHEGMITIFNKPDWVIDMQGMKFQYVMFHIGNNDDDTAGCPLPNEIINGTNITGQGSTLAYKKMYDKIMPVLKKSKNLDLVVSTIGK